MNKREAKDDSNFDSINIIKGLLKGLQAANQDKN